ncbi:hypothetical protein EKH55_4703 [Sinorhizobium alkalisoli]|nr:hypothetical protein EKH55_4703 [Sinorhizobium alkalisoli]
MDFDPASAQGSGDFEADETRSKHDGAVRWRSPLYYGPAISE